ncbi:hypothetical protein ACFQVC_29675 [Streptomyces monticola]|uniref:HNH endonuclease n=1 Tax=Streptomyces monticola TaxID=2666263 RepID=A0ABW2JQG8_9ACTN
MPFLPLLIREGLSSATMFRVTSADSGQHSPIVNHRTPTAGTVKKLYGTAFRCAEPACSRPLYRQNNETGELLLNSHVAHIHARSEGGPRWDPDMPEEQNRGAGNLLLLCFDHATEVDDTPEHFPAELLRRWKTAQLDEYAEIGRSWPLSDVEAEEVAVASFDSRQVGIATAGAKTVLAAARCVGQLASTAHQKRRLPRDAAQAWQALRDRTTRSIPAYDANGERRPVEPSHMEAKPYHDALESALAESVATLEPLVINLVAELHAVSAADKRLAPWCDWVERQSGKLLSASGRWPGRPPSKDDDVLPEAIAKLQHASRQLSAAWRGDDASNPPEPEAPVSAPVEMEQQRAVREHCELLDAAGPWARATHRDYDAELYSRLVEAMQRVVDLPHVPSTLTVGLDATARRAAKVARNADDETYRALIHQATEQRPLACAVSLLRHLMLTAKDSERHTLQAEAMEEAAKALRAESWQTPDVWVDNRFHSRLLLAASAEISSAATVRQVLADAIEGDSELLHLMLGGVAQWSEQRDSRTWEHSGVSCQIAELPTWFPTEEIAAIIREELPDLEPADEDESERHRDDLHRLGSQVLWIAAGHECE